MSSKWRSSIKHDLVIEVWKSLDCESVGAPELKEIQCAIRERFGEAAVESPASIARMLADEGAALRHPEVLEYDARWREQSIDRLGLQALNFFDMEQARPSLCELERVRQEFQRQGDSVNLRRQREAVVKSRQELITIAGSKSAEERRRAEAKEIAEWLAVWLRSPELFEDWLDLRRRSADFRKRFGVSGQASEI
jgi:hypothetical protein